jgi:hypothetical protein
VSSRESRDSATKNNANAARRHVSDLAYSFADKEWVQLPLCPDFSPRNFAKITKAGGNDRLREQKMGLIKRGKASFTLPAD